MAAHHSTDPAQMEKHHLWCEVLPKPDVTDQRAKQWVLDVLAMDALAQVDFSVSTVKFAISPKWFRQVALRVQFDDIRVYERNGANAQIMDWFNLIDLPSDAAYFRNLDIMVLRKGINDIYHQAIVVHECVHAMFDMFGDRSSPLNVTTANSEAVAYIAQALFARASYNAISMPNKTNIFVDETDAAQQQVFQKAWDLAGKMLAGGPGAKRVSDADLASISTLIPTTTTYSAKPVNIDFNGIAQRMAACG